MNKRDFIKTSLLGFAGLQFPSISLAADATPLSFDYWMWIRPNTKDSDAAIKQRYTSYREAGVRGLLFEDYSVRHFQIAKSLGLETHRWMWTMNRGEQDLLSKNPEYYAVSRSGKSCADQPPYVNYYRFLCPSHPDVPKYLEDKAREQLEKEDIDGLHLDYLR